MVFLPLIAALLSFLSFVGCILVLSMSMAKWETFKRMLLALLAIAFLVVATGGLAAWLFRSTVVAVLTGLFCVPASLLGAAVTGWHHDGLQRARVNGSRLIGL
ncbi:MAG: hypothetical protein HY233_04290 [Acidobacteriales bacterium]|nr:hypothetical protein [Candidatus Koribacter versatilis]MBI3645164.1 hypothetical protein [Terriglobales bacterium]